MRTQKLILQILIASLICFVVAACSESSPLSTPILATQRPTATVSPTTVPTATAAAPIRVLFIGNSLTFYHNMPYMFAELAQSGGHQVEVRMFAPPGWTLADHSQSSATLKEIQAGNWDLVVLQEGSWIPAVPHLRDEKMYPAAGLLDERIRESGAETVLFMTWGSRDGLPEEGYEDFTEMQAQIQTGYLGVADVLGARVVPVGTAWQNAIDREPKLNLWQMDGIHPSKEGSYLAANVFYAFFFDESPEGLIYNADLPVETVQFLQSVAAKIVLEDFEH